MKKITFSLLMLCASIGFAQNAPITFETGAFGNTWAWSAFENGTNIAPAIVANPSMTGLNTSATVCRFTPVAAPSGMPWAGFESAHGAGIGTFNLTAANCTIKILVYKSVISDVGIKFATASGASSGEIKVANTVINQWEELTFNFSSKIIEASSTGIDQIIFFPDFQANRATNNVCYIDNVRFSAQVVTADPGTPTVAAPIPTRPAANVISMFSNTYVDVPVDTWKTGWSQANFSEVQIAGNATKKYTSLDFVGVETVTNPINASAMTHFHVDAWTPNMTTFRIKLVDAGADGLLGQGTGINATTEHELAFTPTLSGWNSYDLLLSNFTNLTNRTKIVQLIFSGLPVAGGTVFIDNVYFANTPLANQSFASGSVKMYPNPASDVFTIEALKNIDSLQVFNVLGQEVFVSAPKSNTTTVDVSSFNTGVYVAKVTIDGVSSTSRFVKN